VWLLTAYAIIHLSLVGGGNVLTRVCLFVSRITKNYGWIFVKLWEIGIGYGPEIVLFV